MNYPSFIIAEAGVNHNGKVEIAKKLCDAALKAGANAVKFQTWKTEELIVPKVKTAEYQKRNTKEDSQFKMLKKLELSFDDFRRISDYCKKIGIMFLSTPGDNESADFLNQLLMPAFKIGSDDLDNVHLIKHIAQKKNPMLISTGMSNLKEVEKTLHFVKNFNDRIVFLHCTSNYPSRLDDLNLKAIITMRKHLKTLIGYSDHSTTIWVPSVAVCLGAKVIEKHITLDKNMKGPDHKSSLDPPEFAQMIHLIRRTELLIKKKKVEVEKLPKLISELANKNMEKQVKRALGSWKKQITDSEKRIATIVKKTIVASRSIVEGEKLDELNIRIMRAGKFGLLPREYFDILGKNVTSNIKKNEVITYEKIK